VVVDVRVVVVFSAAVARVVVDVRVAVVFSATVAAGGGCPRSGDAQLRQLPAWR
jgi:hypothetical protein